MRSSNLIAHFPALVFDAFLQIFCLLSGLQTFQISCLFLALIPASILAGMLHDLVLSYFIPSFLVFCLLASLFASILSVFLSIFALYQLNGFLQFTYQISCLIYCTYASSFVTCFLTFVHACLLAFCLLALLLPQQEMF